MWFCIYMLFQQWTNLTAWNQIVYFFVLNLYPENIKNSFEKQITVLMQWQMTQKYTTQSFSRIVLWTKSVMKVISFIKIFSAITSSWCQEKPSTFGFWFVSFGILSTSSHLIEPEKYQLNAGRASGHTQKHNFDGFCLHKSHSHYPPKTMVHLLQCFCYLKFL